MDVMSSLWFNIDIDISDLLTTISFHDNNICMICHHSDKDHIDFFMLLHDPGLIKEINLTQQMVTTNQILHYKMRHWILTTVTVL
jgi:hypothetical protein